MGDYSHSNCKLPWLPCIACTVSSLAWMKSVDEVDCIFEHHGIALFEMALTQFCLHVLQHMWEDDDDQVDGCLPQGL